MAGEDTKSAVREWVSAVVVLASTVVPMYDLPGSKNKKTAVTLRLGPLSAYRLEIIASNLGETRTSAAEELLAAALVDAWAELGLPAIDDETVERVVSEVEGGQLWPRVGLPPVAVEETP